MTTVMIVDDSALVRKVLTELVNTAPDLEVVGSAPDPLVARRKIKELNPDVLTLDVEMPKMDGLDFLEKIMRLRPMPVVMVSSLTEQGNEITLRALELGAVDFVTKPKAGVAEGLTEYAEQLHDKIRAAASARVSRRSGEQRAEPVPRTVSRVRAGSEKLIVAGASTGGTEAIRLFLRGLPAQAPAVLITQHMPEGFTRSFAERLDQELPLSVQEGRNGQRVRPGNVYIAPGGRHMVLRRDGADYVIGIEDRPPVNRHRPSVDVLFESVSVAAGKNAVGIIMTGMGNDGAAGLKMLHEAGAVTLAQDEATCVVYGMPKEALEAGGVSDVSPLGSLATAAIRAIERSGQMARL